MATYKCKHCGIEKKRGYDKRRTYEYCSRECYKKHKTLLTEKNCVCLWCNKKFHVKPSVKVKGGGKYCSLKCRDCHKWKLMDGQETFKDRSLIRNSPKYKSWRIKVLKLHDYKCDLCSKPTGSTCECCGHKTFLHVHHKEPFSGVVEKRFDLNNAEVLCDKCHLSKHSIDNKNGFNSVKLCLVCNKRIMGQPNYVSNRKFCSSDCYHTYDRQRRASKENSE